MQFYIYYFCKKDKKTECIIWASEFNIKIMTLNGNFYFDYSFIKTNKFYQTLILMYYDEKTVLFIPGVFTLFGWILSAFKKNFYT